MKQIVLMLLSALSLQGVLFSQTINVDDPAQYLPAQVQNFYIGEPKQAFLSATDSTKWTRDTKRDHLFVAYTSQINEGKVSGVTLKFDTPEGTINAEAPLYEILIMFVDSTSALQFASEKFTTFPRMTELADKEWFLPTNRDYRLIVRLKGNTLRIIANMNGTEWGFD